MRLFFSYAWSDDSEKRCNISRVRALANEMTGYGWDVWIDHERLVGGNIDAAVVDGIEQADFVVVCITSAYCEKVQNALRDPRNRDNCAKEWSYAMVRHKAIHAVIMEPQLRDTSKWPVGSVAGHLGGCIYSDLSGDDVSLGAESLHNSLHAMYTSRSLQQPCTRHRMFNAAKFLRLPVVGVPGDLGIKSYPQPPPSPRVRPKWGGCGICTFARQRILRLALTYDYPRLTSVACPV